MSNSPLPHRLLRACLPAAQSNPLAFSEQELLKLFWHGLAHLPAIQGSPEVQQQWMNWRRQVLAHNLSLKQTIEELRQVFHKQHIPYIELKGLDLCQRLYGSMGDRLISDWDIWVPATHQKQALELLQTQGFVFQSVGPSPIHQVQSKQVLAHYPPLRKDHLCVEIHHRLFTYRSKANVFFFEHWQELCKPKEKPTDKANKEQSQWAMPPALEYLFLLHHFYQHIHQGNARLKWLADLYYFRKQYALDGHMEELRGLAQQMGMGKLLEKSEQAFHKGEDSKLFRAIAQDGGQAYQRKTYLYFQKIKALGPRAWLQRSFRDAFPSPAYMRYRYGSSNPMQYLKRLINQLKD